MSMAIDEMKCSIREAKATELPIAKVQELAEGLAVK